MSSVLRTTWGDGSPREVTYNLDLGGGHYLKWTSAYDQYEYVAYGDVPAEAKTYCRSFGTLVRVGAIVYHPRPEIGSYCSALLRFALTPWERDHPEEIQGKQVWTFDGNFDAPTFSPSFVCHCNTCHGFIRAGRWTDAGCTHPKGELA